MPHITIISSSVRQGRNSHRVALFFKTFIEAKKLASVEILDLAEYQFPIFEERLSKQSNPTAQLLAFAENIKKAESNSTSKVYSIKFRVHSETVR